MVHSNFKLSLHVGTSHHFAPPWLLPVAVGVGGTQPSNSQRLHRRLRNAQLNLDAVSFFGFSRQPQPLRCWGSWLGDRDNSRTLWHVVNCELVGVKGLIYYRELCTTQTDRSNKNIKILWLCKPTQKTQQYSWTASMEDQSVLIMVIINKNRPNTSEIRLLLIYGDYCIHSYGKKGHPCVCWR